MKKTIFSVFLCAGVFQLLAQKISLLEAQHAAEAFYSSIKNISSISPVSSVLVLPQPDTTYYVFNFSDTGFVIISAEKQVPPVLGYSYESFFTGQNIPPALQGLLQEYTELIRYVRTYETNVRNSEALLQWENLLKTQQTTRTQIYGPMIPCKWDQGAYYNGLCPEDPEGPGGRVYAGCVATAMGMVMYWFRHPSTGEGSNGYWSDYGWLQVHFWQSQYQWENMPTQLIGPNFYVAKLLYDAGVAVNMMYSPNGSGAYMEDAASAMINHFKYNPGLRLVYRDMYSLQEWKNILKQQLNQNYPLIYAGYGSSGPGHAFVCDGYDSNDLFHFNWGWSGYYNGFYMMDYLTPGGYNFSSWQMAIVDCFPVDEPYPQYCQGQKVLTHTAGSFTDGSGPLNYTNNASCSWLIKPDVPVEYIQLIFHQFSTEPNADMVCIYEGSTTQSPLLGCFSGNALPPQIFTQSDALLVTFQSNASITDKGFFAEYIAKPARFCSGIVIIEEPSGTIEDGSGEYAYQPNALCRWWIKPPDAQNITLTFTKFQTESNKDFVILLDPSTYPSTEITRFSGNQLPPVYTHYGPSIIILFRTDAYNEYDGWELHYATNVADMQETYSNDIMIYPTISENFIYIYFPFPEAQFAIYSLTGQLAQSGSIKNGTHSIDINHLASGAYLIVLSDNTQNIIKRQLFFRK